MLVLRAETRGRRRRPDDGRSPDKEE